MNSDTLKLKILVKECASNGYTRTAIHKTFWISAVKVEINIIFQPTVNYLIGQFKVPLFIHVCICLFACLLRFFVTLYSYITFPHLQKKQF